MSGPEPRYLAFRVDGVPVTQGSMVGFVSRDGKRVAVTHRKRDGLLEWRKAIGTAARAAGGRLFSGRVAVEATFWLPRPARPARDYPQGDLDKLVRGLLDALTGITWEDDVQVVALMARKEYAVTTIPGLDVTVCPAASELFGAD